MRIFFTFSVRFITGIDANIIEHRSLYIFGLNYDDDELTPNDKTDKAKKSHGDFVNKNSEFFDGINSDLAKAYLKFIQTWEPKNERKNGYLLNIFISIYLFNSNFLYSSRMIDQMFSKPFFKSTFNIFLFISTLKS